MRQADTKTMSLLRVAAVLVLLVMGLDTDQWGSANTGLGSCGVTAMPESIGDFSGGDRGVALSSYEQEKGSEILEESATVVAPEERPGNAGVGDSYANGERPGPVSGTRRNNRQGFDLKRTSGEEVRKLGRRKGRERENTRGNYKRKRKGVNEVFQPRSIGDGKPDGVSRDSNSKYGDLGSLNTGSSQKENFFDGVTGGISPLRRTVGVSTLGGDAHALSSTPVSDDENFTDTSSGSGHADYGSSESSFDDDFPHDSMDHTEQHPLGAEFARLQDEVLNGVVPQGVTSPFDQHGFPGGGASHDLWPPKGYGQDIPGHGGHPYGGPTHDQAVGMVLAPNGVGFNHPYTQDLSQDVGVHMGSHMDGHIGSHMDGHIGNHMVDHMGSHRATNDIAFGFGTHDTDMSNGKWLNCFETCKCQGLTVSCFWNNLTEVPSGISPATKTL